MTATVIVIINNIVVVIIILYTCNKQQYHSLDEHKPEFQQTWIYFVSVFCENKARGMYEPALWDICGWGFACSLLGTWTPAKVNPSKQI